MQPMPATRMAPPAPRTMDRTPESIEGGTASFGGGASCGTCAVLLVAAFAFAFVDRFARLLHVRPATGGDDTVALAPSTHRNAPRSAPLAPRSMLRARVVRIASYDVSCKDDDTGWWW